jgi:hypothetical protein
MLLKVQRGRSFLNANGIGKNYTYLRGPTYVSQAELQKLALAYEDASIRR